jgi:hypothetical protein
VGIVNLRPQTEKIKYPRAALVRFPRGATVGTPGDAAQQRHVLEDALRLFDSATQPGTIAELDYKWSGPGP